MMDKSKEIEKQNRLREWRRQNCEEAKEIVVKIEKFKEIATQAEKSSKWKGLRTMFSPFTSYQVLDFVEEELEVMVAQMTIEKTTNSPNENTQ